MPSHGAQCFQFASKLQEQGQRVVGRCVTFLQLHQHDEVKHLTDLAIDSTHRLGSPLRHQGHQLLARLAGMVENQVHRHLCVGVDLVLKLCRARHDQGDGLVRKARVGADLRRWGGGRRADRHGPCGDPRALAARGGAVRPRTAGRAS